MMFSFFLPSLTAVVLAYGLAPIVASSAVRWDALDVPGERKIHDRPIPRLGGLSVIGAVAITALLDAMFWGQLSVPPDLIMGLGIGVIPIVCISIIDDLRGVRPGVKFLFHLVAARGESRSY